jgi:hypothetical protein
MTSIEQRVNRLEFRSYCNQWYMAILLLKIAALMFTIMLVSSTG